MFSPTAHVNFETAKTRFRKSNIIIIFFRLRQMQLLSFRKFRICGILSHALRILLIHFVYPAE